jgi:hypothetical protein
MAACEVTISKEKSLVSRTGALEFAKGFMCDGVRTDLFPISVRIVRSLVYGVAASMFSTLGIRSLRVSYRLRGASFRVYSRRGVTLNQKNQRWRRHYLMHSPSGIYPLPVEFWLTFPERGVLTCYEFGMLRSLLLDKVAPKQFHDKEMEGLRTFSPVSKKDSLRIIMALVAHFYLELHQMDVKTAFLNGELQEEVYMDQPFGFSQEGSEHLVCRLRKSIYGRVFPSVVPQIP